MGSMKMLIDWNRGAAIALVLAVTLPAWAVELKRVAPETVGMSSARFDRLGKAFQTYVEDEALPGSTILI